MTQEKHTRLSDGSLITTKTYTYDAYGHRIGMRNAPQGQAAKDFTYSYDVHGSVSLVLNESDGTDEASYGYDPYGNKDSALTSGDVEEDNPRNPYRYAAKRLDAGSDSYDTGARRFGPDVAHFLEQDLFLGSLNDLTLTLDPLTQNRYSLAAGNPISYVEWDGHVMLKDADAGASKDPGGIGDADPDQGYVFGAKGPSVVPDGGTQPPVELDGRILLVAAKLSGCAHSWCGTRGAHDAVRDALSDHLCPAFTLNPFARWGCTKELPIPPGFRERADVVVAGSGEFKPDKPGRIAEGRRQVGRYVDAVNKFDPENPARLGEPFDEFTVDYNGHRLIVRWAKPGVAAYRPDCAPDCDRELNLDEETWAHRLKRWSEWITRIPLPMRIPIPAPIVV